ncbi:MAG: 16S rRNA (adenine(1518)-N(6)/adenine(1519)-N(6))-dimethyltransferase RsmA [bacterium]|nr:16S rRNA (adenine(1518)-N(6)/adenine(1519)-N(6))-dimethyltransferase RsmA [bacterium]
MNYLQRAKNFRTKKRLGQNFLISTDAINTIIEKADIQPTDTVVEIGAGIGFVTEQLVKYAKEVIAIELDENAIKQLEKIDCDNLKILHQDILKTDISELCSDKVKIIANIPYYITSPIIAHLLGEIDDLANKNRNSISDIILMVQYEVAQRIVATEKSPAKQYGLLTILSQFWADCEIIKKVGKKCFFPAPKVDSALVRLTVREKPLLELDNYTHFRKTLKAAFSMRRKNIKNCLLSGGFSKENIQKSLTALGFTENTRGETISIKDFGELSKELIKNETN